MAVFSSPPYHFARCSQAFMVTPTSALRVAWTYSSGYLRSSSQAATVHCGFFAVTWENVDLDRRTTCACQSTTYQRKVKTPKTQVGIRTLAIDATTASHLAMWKERQATELAKIGVKQTEKTPVCRSDTGGWYRIDNFEHWWSAWCKDHEAADLLGNPLASNAPTSENAAETPSEGVETEDEKCLHFVSSRSNPRHKESRPAA